MYYSNIAEAWKHDPVKEMTNKLSNGAFQTNNSRAEIYDLKNEKKYNSKNMDMSDINSLSIMSDNTDLRTIDSDISYAPVESKKKPFSQSHKKKRIYNKIQYMDDSDNECNDNMKHMHECNWCHDNLMKLVNSKVDKKFKELILENKLKQLEHFTTSTKQSDIQTSTSSNTCWKDTLIIVAGIVIALIIILLIVKSFNK